jgi:MSHA biogenesis protein MshQ
MLFITLNLENAFGPETEALAVPIYTEYLDQGQWRANTEDNCTAIALQQSAGDIIVTHDTQSSNNLTSLMSNLSINSSLVGGLLPSSSFTVGPFLSDGEALPGSFYIELAPKSSLGHWSNHLNYDWDGDGDIDSDDKPAANITLGIYRGNERTLHWREVLN